MKYRRVFGREFKLEAVKKVVEQGLSYCAFARELGIRDNLIHNWRIAFEADGTLNVNAESTTSVDAELKRLGEENRQLKMERDILKKATAFFVREILEMRFHPRTSKTMANCNSMSSTRSHSCSVLQVAPAQTIEYDDKAKSNRCRNQTHLYDSSTRKLHDYKPMMNSRNELRRELRKHYSHLDGAMNA